MTRAEMLRELELAAKDLQRRQRWIGERRQALYGLVREARQQGASWGDLAKATGLSRERVRQIAG